MLEKDYQLSAYKKLAAAGGMKTPGAITSARNSANTAKLLAEELTGLILDTIVYPDTITSYVSTIRTTTTGLTNIGELATKHADLLAGYADCQCCFNSILVGMFTAVLMSEKFQNCRSLLPLVM